MLNWLVEQVNWLIETARNTYNWVVSFIQNPYATLRSLFDWVYSRAVQFVDAVKREIADWTWGLFQGINRWISWFDNLYNRVIAPAIAQIGNLVNSVYNAIAPIVLQLINNFVGAILNTINGVINLVNYGIAAATAAIANLSNLFFNTLANVLQQIAWLKANIVPFNPADIWRKIEELYKFVAHIDALIIKIVLDSLLDWLEDKLGEALE